MRMVELAQLQLNYAKKELLTNTLKRRFNSRPETQEEVDILLLETDYIDIRKGFIYFGADEGYSANCDHKLHVPIVGISELEKLALANELNGLMRNRSFISVSCFKVFIDDETILSLAGCFVSQQEDKSRFTDSVTITIYLKPSATPEEVASDIIAINAFLTNHPGKPKPGPTSESDYRINEFCSVTIDHKNGRYVGGTKSGDIDVRRNMLQESHFAREIFNKASYNVDCVSMPMVEFSTRLSDFLRKVCEFRGRHLSDRRLNGMSTMAAAIKSGFELNCFISQEALDGLQSILATVAPPGVVINDDLLNEILNDFNFIKNYKPKEEGTLMQALNSYISARKEDTNDYKTPFGSLFGDDRKTKIRAAEKYILLVRGNDVQFNEKEAGALKSGELGRLAKPYWNQYKVKIVEEISEADKSAGLRSVSG